MARKNLGVENAVNPKTGEVDLVGALRFVTHKLNAEKGVVKDGLYNTFTGSMQGRLVKYGIPAGYVADLALLMQEIGLARKIGTGITTTWEIADDSFFDNFVHSKIIKTGINNLRQRHTKSQDLWLLKTKTIPKLQEQITSAAQAGGSEDVPPDLTATLNKVGELIAENEKLHDLLGAARKELAGAENEAASVIAGLKQQVAALEKQVAENANLDQALADAIERARKRS